MSGTGSALAAPDKVKGIPLRNALRKSDWTLSTLASGLFDWNRHYYVALRD
jgi:hypothetical protein